VRGKSKLRKIQLHDLVLGETTGWWDIIHHVALALRGGHVLDKSDAERAATILISSELGCERISERAECKRERFIQMAVSAVSPLSNWTTPVPRERPLGSY
jgi:hypothetical protein